MKKFVCLLVLMSVGCSSESVDVSTPLSSTEAGNAGESNGTAAETGSEIVIDVRSKEEWDTGHVERAVHIPHTEIVDRILEVTQDKDAKIVVYCAVGGRAGKAKTALEELGFTSVENAGGFDDVKDRFK